jgi:DNA-binding CsgD family transcriptional regulator/Cdc6-like AAA superfamily ATPase
MSKRALSPAMIGRQTQLSEMAEALSRARAGAGQVVFLAGEAGVGKTRLLREFGRRIQPRSGVAVYAGNCYDERPAPPYGPFAELLRALATAPDAAPLAESAGPWAGDLRRLLPELTAPLGEDAPSDPQAEKRRLFQAIYQVLRPRDGRAHVLVLEDLHWADQASQELLHYLARAVERDRVLIIGTYRTDEMHRLHPLAATIARLTRDRRYQELRLSPLSRSELAEMLEATLGEPPAAGLLDALYERTEGNPFFTEEVLDSLLSQGGLAGDAHRARPVIEVAIPLSIKDSILRRVADLDEMTSAILRDAAVVGRRFDFELLLRLSKVGEAELLRALGTLVKRQLVVEEPGGREDRYRFRHELIREALSEEMLRRERRLRHQEVLRALEELHAADPDAVVDQLAYHALHARAAADAARYSEAAGDKAAAVHAYREAQGHYEAALEASEELPADDQRRGGLLARLGTMTYLVGDPRGAAGSWREALGLFRQLGDHRRAADLQRWLGRAAWELGDVADAFAQTRAALDTLAGEPPCRELAMAYSALAHLYMLQIPDSPASAADTIAWGERALTMAEELGDEAVITHALNSIGVALADSGQTEAGLSRLRRSLAIALQADLPVDVVRAYINLSGKLCKKVGSRDEGLGLMREGWAYASRLGYIRGMSKLLTALIYGLLESGKWAELDGLVEEVLRPDYPGPLEDRTRAQHARAILLWARGRPAEARDLLERLLATTDDEEGQHVEHVLSFVHRALGDMEQAAAAADRLVARVQARAGVGPDSLAVGTLALKLLAAAEIYIDVGRRDEALEIIAAMERAPCSGDMASYQRAVIDELRALTLLDERPREAAALLGQLTSAWEEFGCPPDVARLRRRYAAALLRLGPAERELARHELAAARAIAEPLGFAHELAQISALERPEPARPTVAPPRSPEGLTPRELEVLALITRGLSNRAIAETLVISEKTAEVHVRNILGKLGFSSRTQAATYALERGLGVRSA